MTFEELRALVSRERNSLWLMATTIYLLLAPNVDLVPDLGWHDGQRIAQLVLFGVAAVGILIPFTGRSIWAAMEVLPGWSRYLLGSALLTGLISCASAQYPRWALLEWSTLVMTGVLAIAVSASWRTQSTKRDGFLIIVLYVTALVYSVKAVAMYVTMLLVGPEYGLGFSVEELFTGFSNVRFFGHIQTMLLPFLILPAMWWGKTGRHRVMLLVVPAVWWMLAIASGTRGSWVALLIGAVAAVFFGGKSGREWCRWQVVSLFCGACSYIFFVILVPSWFAQPAAFMHRGADIISLRGRDVLWELCQGLLLQHPWLGIGPMHFANRISELGAHPHNAILQLMVEWGIPAAILFGIVFVAGGMFWALHVHRHTANRNPDHNSLILVALLAAMTGAGAQAMVDGVIVMPVSQTLVALICGWALGCRFGGMPASSEPAHGSGKLFRAIVFVAVLGIVVGVTPEIGHLAERESLHLVKQPEGPNPLLLPRFWLHGLIPD